MDFTDARVDSSRARDDRNRGTNFRVRRCVARCAPRKQTISDAHGYGAGAHAIARVFRARDARVFGQPSMGQALPALFDVLPNGDLLIHAYGDFVTSTGTRLEARDFTDTVILGQGERGIAELRFPYTGKYMFHAHVSEFADLGWMGFFEVVD